MSRVIPEEIVGVDLFIPTANDFFSIETAGLPNGDDCLKILGATNRDYKAYQDAQTVSPDLFRDRDPAAWSMVFWFKGGNLSPGTGVRGDQTVMAVMNSTFDGSAFTTAAMAQHILWSVQHYQAAGGSFCGLQFGIPWDQFNPAQNNYPNVGAVFSANVWHMITITNPAAPGGTINMYIDNANTPASSAGRSTNAPIANPASPKFCIGSYSDAGTMNGRDGDYFLGKLSFHNHVLNATERAILYNAMTT